MASLFTLKGAEYIISFITLPYLLRVLGPEKFGAIAFAQTIITYGNLLVDYGFNLTAPRDIAKCDKVDIPKNFAAFYGAKIRLAHPHPFAWNAFDGSFPRLPGHHLDALCFTISDRQCHFSGLVFSGNPGDAIYHGV